MVEFIDFINSGYILYKKRDYIRPKLCQFNNSFISIEKMRHPIVEQIIDGQYKSHNVVLGKDIKGILLYGLNSSGKSTIMKALGLNIILAQMGYYVPADKMEYKPYENLFCRISSYDNLFKGLSSFHLELNELDTILNRFNKNTLILADEICRGTEHLSALIIVATLLTVLIKQDSSFISATHLHELVNIDDIKSNNKIVAKHIQVECDYVNNNLIYHRKLCDGSGPSEYGLDVATFLMKNKTFIQEAIKFRKKIKPMIPLKTSRYNSNKIMDCCSSCGLIPTTDQKSLETHHIIPQKDSNSNGFFKCVKGYHKNKITNLVNLCTTCHDDIDRGKLIIEGYSDTSSGLKLQLKKIDK
jgi:DNA mismatch repair protein MutS